MGERGGLDKARARIKEQVDKVRARERDADAGAVAGKDFGRFDRFTGRARTVLTLAQQEASSFNHTYIGTEHLLLGLIREGEGVAARALTNLGVEPDKVRDAVVFIIGRGDRAVVGEIGLTPRAKKVIELAVDEARRMKHRYVGTEHLLLGLIREGEGIAAGVLESLGIGLDKARAEVLGILASVGHTPKGADARNNVVTCRLGDDDLAALDALVEAGVRSTRSDAASWLIHAGVEANRPLFERVYATVAEIHRLRAEAQDLVQQLAIGDGDAPLATPGSSEADNQPDGGRESVQ